MSHDPPRDPGEDWTERVPDAPELAAALRAIGRIAAAHAAAGAARHPAPSFQWGHLQVYELLGSGSYGEVYRAFDPVLQRAVALKLLRPGNELANHDFIAEARRLARVRHPNVLAVHGADHHAGRVGLWADLIEGRTLEQRLQDGRPSAAETLQHGLHLAEALAAVHAAGLVHGDVKASNVMLDARGRLVLMDFGAGREAADQARLRLIGSPLSMAPEQFEGAPASASSDQYALGALLYRCLTGRHPVAGADFEALRAAHANPQEPDFADLAPGTEPALTQLVQSLLARDPASRPDAAACVDALRAIQGLPAERARRRLRRAVFLSLVLALVATGAGLWHSRVQTERAQSARAEAEAVNAFLTEILAAPRFDGAGDRVRMIDVVDVAAQGLEQRALSTQQRAAVAEVLGRTYRSLGRFAEAARWFGYAESVLPVAPGDAERRLGLELQRLQALAQHCEVAAPTDLLDALRERALAGAPELRIAWHEAAADIADCAGEPAQVVSALRLARAAADAAGPALARESMRLGTALGGALLRSGETKAAIEILERAFADVSGDATQDPGMLLPVQYNLAIAYSYAGRAADAERLIRQALDILRVRSTEPYYLARFEGALGGLLYDLGRSAESLERTEAALDILRSRFPADDVQALALEGNRGNALKALGRHAEAEAAYRRAIEGLTAHGGLEAQHALLHGFNLVELLNDTGRPVDAERLARDSLERAQALLGAEHLVTLELRDALGVARLAQGDAAGAVALHRAVLEAKQRTLGDDSQYTLQCMHRLARALYREGARGEALALVARARDGLYRALGAEHAAARAAAADYAAWVRSQR